MTRIAMFMVVVGLMMAGCSSTPESASSGFELASLTCVKKSVTPMQANEDVKALQGISGVAHVHAQLSEGAEAAPRSVEIKIRAMANCVGAVRKKASKLGYEIE